MPLARSLLLEAAGSYAVKSEDRLTELLGVALRDNEPFALALAGKAGLELYGPLQVTTQLQLTSARPDMQLEGYGPDGAPAVLWIENKIWARLTNEQEHGYPRRLEENFSRTDRRLVLITPKAREVPVWFASDSVRQIRVLIRPHLAGARGL